MIIQVIQGGSASLNQSDPERNPMRTQTIVEYLVEVGFNPDIIPRLISYFTELSLYSYNGELYINYLRDPMLQHVCSSSANIDWIYQLKPIELAMCGAIASGHLTHGSFNGNCTRVLAYIN